MKELKAYKCDYCGKLYQRKYHCERHEIVCNKNPDNFRACFGCRFCEFKMEKIYFDNPLGGETVEERKMLFCSKKDIFVYPPRVEFNSYGFGYELGNHLNEPMPKLCELREDIVDYYLNNL